MMFLIVILVVAVVIIYFMSRNQSVKNVFRKEEKYYTIDDEFNARRKERQDEIDRLLSKIEEKTKDMFAIINWYEKKFGKAPDSLPKLK